jgi:peptidyl-prolyl cis-trans isomerase B (cyclophilin B)
VRRSLLTAALLLGLAGCGSSSSHTTITTTSTASSGKTSAATTSGTVRCQKVAAPPGRAGRAGPNHLSAPTLKLDPRRTYTVTVLTNCGTFAFTLDVKSSPKTSASFYYLVKRGFFDGLTFHRIAADFVIQGGDPTGSGGDGPGYQVVEAPPQNTQYVRGDVAMAKTQTDPSGASGSQFFVVTAQNATQSAGLTPDYALVGKVVSGLNVVEAIGRLPTNPPDDGAPTSPVVMSKVTVTSS